MDILFYLFSELDKNLIKKMKRSLGFLLIVIALLSNVQYAFGAAVMSVDLGSEFMKVK